MLPDPLATLPGWLLAGLGLGAVLAGIVAAAFAVGTRTFEEPDGRGRGDGGESRRRGEIRRYLRAIDEPFREDARVDGRRVAFFLPDRDVAITFDARAYFRLDRAGRHAILIEHELPGARLGDRLPFETPDPAPGTEAGVEAAYAVLGLAPSADRTAVEAAYREQVKAAHPDHGGDPEAFARVREAYEVAIAEAD